MKSLQNQYLLVKEGKISKEHFLKQARTLFPQYINQYSTFDTTVNTLKKKNILNEVAGVVVTKTTQDWIKTFNKNITEAAKAIEKNPTKEVTDMETRGYNYENKDNIDNIYGNQFLDGYYTEMKDPKNAKKTVDELKSIVAKNLAKDFSYYTKNGQFGVKGIGYTDEVPGLGKDTQPTSKNASVLGGRDEVNSESEIVKNSLVGQTKFTKKSLKESSPLSMNESDTQFALSNKELIAKNPTTNKSIMDVYNMLSEIDDIDFIQEVGIIISSRDWANRGEFANKQKIYREIQKHLDDENIINDLEEELYQQIKRSSSSLNESGLREAIRSLVKQAINERTKQEIDGEKKEVSDEIKSKEDQKKGLDASIAALKARQGQINAEKPTDTTGA